MANFGFRNVPFPIRLQQRRIVEREALATSRLSDSIHRLHSIASKFRPLHRKWARRALRQQRCDF
ncbi:MAG: hypothetical protein OEZ08_12330 [Betaproteobacteria bacterium]|nr:hypothetical protein [Betaproteobacteria bacterium]